MEPSAPTRPPRVLIVKLSSLGDLFHALPAAHNLKAALNAQIDWVTQPEYAELVRFFAIADRVITFPRRGFLRAFLPFLSDLRQAQYDAAIDLQGLFKSALVTRLARARRRIGPSFCREGSVLLYSEIAGKRALGRHAVEQALDVVDYMGLPRLPVTFPVRFPERKVDGARPRIALLPVSRWPSKNWPVRHFIDLAVKLVERRSGSVFILGGPGDVEVCREIEKAAGGGVFNLAGKTGLAEMGAVLREMDVLVANDSGPIHMAAAVGTPVVAMFGPTDPRRTGPYGPLHRVLCAGLPCQPCYKRNCRKHGLACLANIQPREVLAAVDEVLQAGGRLRGEGSAAQRKE